MIANGRCVGAEVLKLILCREFHPKRLTTDSPRNANTLRTGANSSDSNEKVMQLWLGTSGPSWPMSTGGE